MCSRCLELAAWLLAVAALAGCNREARELVDETSNQPSVSILSQSAIRAGGGSFAEPFIPAVQGNAFALSEGKRLFDSFNCSGCHARGGGGIGPALMDARWIYGS